jgi:hypothetical protein
MYHPNLPALKGTFPGRLTRTQADSGGRGRRILEPPYQGRMACIGHPATQAIILGWQNDPVGVSERVERPGLWPESRIAFPYRLPEHRLSHRIGRPHW